MSIKNKPSSRFRPLGNILLILGGLFLLANIFLPQLFGPSIPQVPYSLFIHQVDDGDVSRVYVGQNEIRYQLKGEGENQFGQILKTAPIFDLELPKRLEGQGVEFAAAS
jgi:cell division protease FtsH